MKISHASSSDSSEQAIRPLKNKLLTDEIAKRINFAQTKMNPSADGWLFHATFKKQIIYA